VALKVLSEAFANDLERMARFQRLVNLPASSLSRWAMTSLFATSFLIFSILLSASRSRAVAPSGVLLTCVFLGIFRLGFSDCPVWFRG
jgi:hypothetical protein